MVETATPPEPPLRKHVLIRESTRAFFREARSARDMTWFDALHGYVYARWTYLYIGMGIGEHPLGKAFQAIQRAFSRFRRKEKPACPARADRITFADTYHGKVVPLEAATQLVAINEEIRLPDLEHIVPYARARDIVLKNPDHVAVLDCPCRSAREDPCLPLDVCLIVGEPFVSFVLDHHPHKARRITPEEAVAILRAEDERGHVHHAFFKDAMLGRFYAICNCCACCCGAMQAQRNGTPMLASSGYVAQVDANLCIACGLCTDNCQFDAITVVDSIAQVDTEACMGCGVCVGKCTQGALSLARDEAKSAPLEIQQLIAHATQTA
ncbi:MAG: 4Fe-4S binding protein [Anaerolineae bacterium]|nr:4Fe-4S binding protein [Anaerolineae bacterium]